ncbi:hypothetical protein, partial [Bartonella sp. AA86SXKL]|uniref:hypothetical protein n=1 Tax=Bartonella sp. AA86SXKL TaxID=3243441 RepID=UPI0035D0A7A6
MTIIGLRKFIISQIVRARKVLRKDTWLKAKMGDFSTLEKFSIPLISKRKNMRKKIKIKSWRGLVGKSFSRT